TAAARAAARSRWLLGLRAAAVLSAIAAIANLPVLLRTAQENVILAILPEQSQSALDNPLLARSTDTRGASDARVGIVSLGPGGGLARDLSEVTQENGMPSGATAAEALLLAASLLPAGAAGRIVMEDDGSQSSAALSPVIPILRQRGIVVDYLPRQS